MTYITTLIRDHKSAIEAALQCLEGGIDQKFIFKWEQANLSIYLFKTFALRRNDN